MTRLDGAEVTDSEFVAEVLSESGMIGEYVSIDERALSELLKSHYGLAGELERLATEKDDTFHLKAATGEYLVKVSTPLEPPEDIDLQVSAMLHLEKTAPEIAIQRVLRTLDGAATVSLTEMAGPRVLRVMSFLPGSLMAHADPDAEQLAAAGAALAALGLALAGFEHPRMDRKLVWKLTLFHRLSGLVAYVEDRGRRRLAGEIFELFEERVAPRIPRLETQVIHSDFTGYNVIVDPGAPGYVTGIIDFGDCVRAPIITDPAVPMSNLLGADPTDPWARPCAFLSGFHAVRPLAEDEAPLVVEMALARMTLRAVLAAWRADRSPERRDYILEHAGGDWARLEATLAKGLDFGRRAVVAATSGPG